MLVDARGEMLGGAPPESSLPTDECLMDARKQTEDEIGSKTEASLKEGLGQQLKTDHMKKSRYLTRDCLNSVPYPGTDIEDEEGKPGNDRNEEGRHQCVEDTDLDERGYDVEITDTEASDDLLYEEVLTVLTKSAQRKEHRKAILERKKKRARIDPNTIKATIDELRPKLTAGVARHTSPRLSVSCVRATTGSSLLGTAVSDICWSWLTVLYPGGLCSGSLTVLTQKQKQLFSTRRAFH
ncbi:uncharacterized protein LOC119329447 [Triticum dicoccoides]|uniref:uncharacterized protein LOC119329447 n=1 Tax=Triticum dicoccoides TaxID=85692 RepID=UPI001890C434|nr:uncharacterized protein LOC119329447 [Triticum dicoccoides]